MTTGPPAAGASGAAGSLGRERSGSVLSTASPKDRRSRREAIALTTAGSRSYPNPAGRPPEGARRTTATAHQARRTKQIDEIRGEFLAIDTALERLSPGDLCLILVDQVQEALDHLAARVKEAKEKVS